MSNPMDDFLFMIERGHLNNGLVLKWHTQNGSPRENSLAEAVKCNSIAQGATQGKSLIKSIAVVATPIFIILYFMDITDVYGVRLTVFVVTTLALGAIYLMLDLIHMNNELNVKDFFDNSGQLGHDYLKLQETLDRDLYPMSPEVVGKLLQRSLTSIAVKVLKAQEAEQYSEHPIEERDYRDHSGYLRDTLFRETFSLGVRFGLIEEGKNPWKPFFDKAKEIVKEQDQKNSSQNSIQKEFLSAEE